MHMRRWPPLPPCSTRIPTSASCLGRNPRRAHLLTWRNPWPPRCPRLPSSVAASPQTSTPQAFLPRSPCAAPLPARPPRLLPTSGQASRMPPSTRVPTSFPRWHWLGAPTAARASSRSTLSSLKRPPLRCSRRLRSFAWTPMSSTGSKAPRSRRIASAPARA